MTRRAGPGCLATTGLPSIAGEPAADGARELVSGPVAQVKRVRQTTHRIRVRPAGAAPLQVPDRTGTKPGSLGQLILRQAS
jgi:hypothetical protein